VTRIILLNNHSFSPTLLFIQRIANLLLVKRTSTAIIRKNWIIRFIQHHNDILSKYLTNYVNMIINELNAIILRNSGSGLKFVKSIIQKYGIVKEDIFNFDETGFQMSVITRLYEKSLLCPLKLASLCRSFQWSQQCGWSHYQVLRTSATTWLHIFRSGAYHKI
jgi:hypothetical protein